MPGDLGLRSVTRVPDDSDVRLPLLIRSRLVLPLIAAPMTQVSGPELATAACRAGIIGAFPAHNAAGTAELGGWLVASRRELDCHALSTGAVPAPLAVNLVVHKTNRRLGDDLACLIEHRVELVIASVGAPDEVVGALHDAGAFVFADAASLRHVDRCAAAGVDGLVLLSAGAGGQPGWANPLAFIRAARERFAGPLVLAGGISDGAALWAAVVAGCDLGYMGTRFIATTESRADPEHRAMLLHATLDDVVLTSAVTGIPLNALAASLNGVAADASHPGDTGEGFAEARLHQHSRVRPAGHTVGSVRAVLPVAELIAQVRAEYRSAQDRSLAIASGFPTTEPPTSQWIE